MSVELHPNHATGWVRIQLAQEPTNATTVKIIDGFGQVLRVVEMSQSVKRLSLAGLKPGIYTVRVGETSKRLIVE